MDIIFINELRLDILVGIYEWERRVPQTVELNLEIGIAGRHASDSDEIGDTIDYAVVVRRISETLRENHFSLLEKLAEHVAQLVLGEFKAPWVQVSVAKLSPLKGVKRLGIRIERGQRV